MFSAPKQDGLSRNERLAATITTAENLERQSPAEALAYCKEVLKKDFNFLHHITESAILSEFLGLIFRATNLDSVQQTFGPKLISETTLRLRMAEPRAISECIDSFSKKSVAGLLDTIQQLGSLGALARSYGAWAATAWERCEQIIEALAAISPSPFARYAATSARAFLSNAIADPALSDLLPPSGTSEYKEHTRRTEPCHEDLGDEHNELRRQVLVPPPYNEGFNLRRIARDTLGVFDRHDNLVAVAPCAPHTLPAPAPVLLSQVDKALDLIRESWDSPKAKFLSVMSQVGDEILRPLVDSLDDEKRLQVREWMHPVFSSPLWRIIILAGRDVRELENEEAKHLLIEQEAAAERARDSTQQYVDLIATTIENSGLVVYKSLPLDLLKRFQANRRGGNLQLAEEIGGMLRDELQLAYSMTPADVELRHTFISLQQGIDRLIDDFRISYVEPSLSEKLIKKREGLQSWIEDAYPMHEGSVLARINDLLTVLTRVAQEKFISLPVLNVVTIEEFQNDPLVCPFPARADEELGLLLAHVHRADVVTEVEANLGIDLKALDRNCQLHLNRYLAGLDDAGFARINRCLQLHAGHKQVLMRAFLTNAEDSRYTEVFLRLAETLPTSTVIPILEKFGAIADTIGDIEDLLVASGRGGKAPPLVRKIAQNLLGKANRLLEEWGLDSELDNTELFAKLEFTRGSVVLFGSTVKELAKNEDFSLDIVANSKIDVISGDMLTTHDRQQLLGIAEPNIKAYPPSLVDPCLAELRTSLTDPNFRFYILRRGLDIVTFLKFKDLDPATRYLASFNSRHEAKSLAVGSVFFKMALQIEGDDRTLEAVSHKDVPMAKYYPSFGFASSAMSFAGVECIKLTRPPTNLKSPS